MRSLERGTKNAFEEKVLGEDVLGLFHVPGRRVSKDLVRGNLIRVGPRTFETMLANVVVGSEDAVPVEVTVTWS